jgi:predicted nucleic acid-binding protein
VRCDGGELDEAAEARFREGAECAKEPRGPPRLTQCVAFICDLGATEVASALGRACREGRLDQVAARRLHRRLHRHVASGVVERLDLTPKVHREAERLLLSATAPLRGADALHVALASLSEAATVVTHDPRLTDAARSAGIAVAMPGSDGEPAEDSPRRGR